MPVYRLDSSMWFPSPEFAWNDGMVAVGGDLSVERLVLAYRSGIFPWYNEGEPILWWSPNPRYVIFPKEIKVSKSMRKVLRDEVFRVTYDTDFEAVIRNCQQLPRKGQLGTWITEEMVAAYTNLHHHGYAHSVEVWQGDELVGGLYGVSLGKIFFGESKFTKVSNASKTGLIHLTRNLVDKGFELIDCQQGTAHFISLGAVPMPRNAFLDYMNAIEDADTLRGAWTDVFDL